MDVSTNMNNKDKTQTKRGRQQNIEFLNQIAGIMTKDLTKKTDKTLKRLTILQSKNADSISLANMTSLEAEEVINMYWNSFKDISTTDEIVQPISDLPFSTGRIKYAHFAYVEGLIMNLLFNRKIGDLIIDSYVDIRRRFADDPISLNTKWRQYRNNLNKGIVSENPISPLAEAALEDEIEFNNFIAEFNKFIKKTN